MNIEQTKEAIERVAKEYLAPLDEKNHPFQIIWKIQKFKSTIFYDGIIDEYNDFDNIMHTETIPMEIDDFHKVQDMAWLSVTARFHNLKDPHSSVKMGPH